MDISIVNFISPRGFCFFKYPDIISIYESICWDSLFTGPQFYFYFKVELPRKRKEREIIEWDYLGRVITPRVPE